jgi:hypothetical protein
MLTVILKFLKDFEVQSLYRKYKKCLQSPHSSAGGTVNNTFFLFAGTLLFGEKIRQSAALFWFGFRVV